MSILFYAAILCASLQCGLGHIHTSRRRDADSLAPELNRDHPHIDRRHPELLKFTLCFYRDVSESEITNFNLDFFEFVIQEFPSIDAVQVELPGNIAEDILLDMRTKHYVEVVEHTVMRHEYAIKKSNGALYWNLAAIAGVNADDPTQPLFEGTGY
eukprot:Awhi_evm2s12294